jgi:hypothetical protein
VIHAFVLADALYSDEINRLFNDAQKSAITRGVAAYYTQILLTQKKTPLTQAHLLRSSLERLSQGTRHIPIICDEVIREPSCGLFAHGRQLRKLPD